MNYRKSLIIVLVFGCVCPAWSAISIDPGWPVDIPFNMETPSALAVDLDGDGDLEILMGAVVEGQTFAALHHDGTQYLPFNLEETGTLVSPAVGDLDQDGELEIVNALAKTSDSVIIVQDTRGNMLPGWPQIVPNSMRYGSIALGDLTGDGNLEVIVSDEFAVYVFDKSGQILPHWPYPMYKMKNCVAVGDLNRDGRDEVIICASAEPDTWEPNVLYVVSGDAISLPGWPQKYDKAIENRVSPAIGDIDGDGDLEIVINLLDDWHDRAEIDAYHHDGQRVDGWPVTVRICRNEGICASFALADVTDDGKAEIIFSTTCNETYIVRGDGTSLPNWPQDLSLYGQTWATPICVDTTGDTIPEILSAIPLVDDPNVVIWDIQGNYLTGFPLTTHAGVWEALLCDDLDGDGSSELILPFDSGSGVQLVSLDLGSNTYNPQCRPWPVKQADPWRTGFYAGSNRPLHVEITANEEVYEEGDELIIRVGVRNTGSRVEGTLYVALQDGQDNFYFYPDFTTDVVGTPVEYPHLMNHRSSLFEATLSQPPNAGQFTMWVAVVDLEGNLISNVSFDVFE